MELHFKLHSKEPLKSCRLILHYSEEEEQVIEMDEQNYHMFSILIRVKQGLQYDYQPEYNDHYMTQIKNIKKIVGYQEGKYLIIHDQLNIEENRIEKGKKLIRFQIQMKLDWPIMPRICGSIQQLGNWSPEKSGLMFGENNLWQFSLETDSSFDYKYILSDLQGTKCRWENTPNRHYDIVTNEEYIQILDCWEDQKSVKKILQQCPNYLTLNLHYYAPNSYIYISGNTEELGKWDPNKAKKARRYQNFIWNVSFKVNSNRIEYKYLIGNAQHKQWEISENRIVQFNSQGHKDIFDYWNYPLASKIREREHVKECPLCNMDLDFDDSVLGMLCGHIICKKCYGCLPYFKRCPMCRKEFLII